MTPTIIQVIPELDAGGAELSACEISKAVVEAGGHSLIASQGGRLVKQIERDGGRLIKLPMASKNPAIMVRNAFRLAKLIEQSKVDLVHARSRAPAWSALVASRWTNTPFVTTYHGGYKQAGALKNFYNSVMARGDMVIANSNFIADLIRSRHRTDEGRLKVVYRGLNFDKFKRDAIGEDRISRLRQSWGIEENEKIILKAGRLTPRKGQAVVIEAARILKQSGLLEGFVVILAGDQQKRDHYVEQLATQIGHSGLEKQVKIVGHCEDISAAFAIAHISVVASTVPEAFGRAAVESQALCCPVVVADLGAVPETVLAEPDVPAESITGWRVQPENPSALAKMLENIILMPNEQRTELGIRARQHVMRKFSLQTMQLETLKVYDNLLGSDLASQFATIGSKR
jgi:glycosyltransferase involved in cell wall biosynthesis